MLMIRNGKIMLTRGDSAYITVTLKSQEGSAYTMQAGGKLTGLPTLNGGTLIAVVGL